MPFIAGAYNVTIYGSSVGPTDGGFFVDLVGNTGIPITADNFGTMFQDGIFMGAECHIDFICVPTSTSQRDAIHAACWPALKAGDSFGTFGAAAGKLWSNMSGGTSLVATAVAGTTAASTGYTTWTFNNVILSPGFAARIPLALQLRRVPMRFTCFSTTGSLFSAA